MIHRVLVGVVDQNSPGVQSSNQPSSRPRFLPRRKIFFVLKPSIWKIGKNNLFCKESGDQHERIALKGRYVWRDISLPI